MNFIRRWVVNVVREDLGGILDARKEDVDHLSKTMSELRLETSAHLQRAETKLRNSLGTILAAHDQRNQRDAQSLANAMAEEFEYKTKGPYLTAGGIVVPAKFDKDGLKKAFRKARPK